jgi:predicted RNA polymerase sigma factor
VPRRKDQRSFRGLGSADSDARSPLVEALTRWCRTGADLLPGETLSWVGRHRTDRQ